MRLAGRAVAASLIALVIGMAAAFVAASWLQSSTPEANLVWGVASKRHVAAWALAGAHGATLHLKADASIGGADLGEIGDTIGGLLGNDPTEEPAAAEDNDAGFAVHLAPFTILALVGLALALAMKMSAPRDVNEVVTAAVVAGVVHGAALAALAAASTARLGFDIAIVKAGIEASLSPVPVFVLGALWGGVFALLGGLSAKSLADKLPAVLRSIGAGLKRAAIVGSVAAIVGIVIVAIAQSSESEGGFSLGGGDAKLHALGVAMLILNIIFGVVVLAHGPSLHSTIDAGPFSRFDDIGYASQQIGPAKWLLILVPVLACIAAGRVMRKRIEPGTAGSTAVAFGVAWAVALAVVAFMFHIQVLGSFSLASLSGGGEATINAGFAAGMGLVLGTILSYAGLTLGGVRGGAVLPPRSNEPVQAKPTGSDPEPLRERLCPNCAEVVPEGDKFCNACGKQV